jgi:hypothetical protein
LSRREIISHTLAKVHAVSIGSIRFAGEPAIVDRKTRLAIEPQSARVQR